MKCLVSWFLLVGLSIPGLVFAQVYGPGDHEFKFNTPDGKERRYIVHVPASYDPARPTPVLLVIHGGGGNAEGTPAVTLTNDTSEKHGFLAVYPEGTGERLQNGKVVGSWNAGICCPPARDEPVDDVGYFHGLLDGLDADFNVDVRRIFATGMSNGSQMVFRLACEMADRIAAIGPVAAQGVHEVCAPPRPVPVIYFHGTADPCSPYDGGTQCGGCMHEFLEKITGKDLGDPFTWPCDSVPDYIIEWRERNNCPQESSVSYKNGKATCLSWGPCDRGSEVVLCTIEDMGHNWPGGTYGNLCAGATPGLCEEYMNIVGPLSGDVAANEAMWEFFLRHSMPETEEPDDGEDGGTAADASTDAGAENGEGSNCSCSGRSNRSTGLILLAITLFVARLPKQRL